MPGIKAFWVKAPIEHYLAAHGAAAAKPTKYADRHKGLASALLNTAMERYQMVLERSLPRLTVPEWCAVFDACDGVQWESTRLHLAWAHMLDAAGLGGKWGIDQEALAQHLRQLPYASQVAVVDASERFWKRAVPPDAAGWRPVIATIVGARAIAEEGISRGT